MAAGRARAIDAGELNRPGRYSRPLRASASETGQAAVEFVAAVPLVALVLALAWQAVLAGQAAWAAAAAARAAARASAVGGDATAVARTRLGDDLAAGARIHASGDGRVEVSVRIPRVLGALPLGRVEGEGTFRPQDGT